MIFKRGFEVSISFKQVRLHLFAQSSSSSSSSRAASMDILTLSRHFSLSFIASGRSSGLHLVSSHSCCMYVLAGLPVS